MRRAKPTIGLASPQRVARAAIRTRQFLVGAFAAVAVATAANAQQNTNNEPSLPEFAAFSRVIAENPLEGGFPLNVRAMVYANPHECFESQTCNRATLYLAVIGDGELPQFKFYEVGRAYSWRFVRWVATPVTFFDDERDRVVAEFIRTAPCATVDCRDERSREQTVTVSFSLHEMRLIDGE